ncbi:MAG: hypothetical protein HYS22_05700 [Deltaproteobacteria bacterium]|nr:hypothetical protein [Deltaproteobacteria bacterium]
MLAISYDAIISKQSNVLSNSYKLVYFLSGLDATVLGFLFTQSLLGHLAGVSSLLEFVWWGFGICFMFSLLYLWRTTVIDAKLTEFYNWYIEENLRFERLLFDNQNNPSLSGMSTDQKGDYFYKIDSQLKYLVDTKTNIAKAFKKKSNVILNTTLYWGLVVVTVMTYLSSIYFGAKFITSKTAAAQSALNSETRPLE